MTWREDRDALIAQTMAFVHSVTGKQVDFAQFALPPAPPEAGTIATGSREPPAATSVAPSPQFKARAPAGANIPDPGRSDFGNPGQSGLTASNSAITVGTGVGLADQPNAVQSSPLTSGAFGAERFTSIAGQIGLQRDMQSEIRTRVASFRAHQERFRRERQEYFNATLARLRASIDETSPPDAK